MADESKEDLKAAVREAMKEIMAELRPMPTPANNSSVTEIIIRVGSAGARVQGDFGGLGCAAPECPLGSCPAPECPLGASRRAFDSKTQALLQAIEDKTAESAEDLIERLDREEKNQRLVQLIGKYAKKLKVEPPEE